VTIHSVLRTREHEHGSVTMDDELAINWERLKNSGFLWSLPFTFTTRDGIWLLVTLALTALVGLDRFRIQNVHTAALSALAEDRLSAATNVHKQVTLLTEQLRSAREEHDALAARYEAEVETVVILEQELSLLRSESQTHRGSQLASESPRER
jgi:hypothetical protein